MLKHLVNVSRYVAFEVLYGSMFSAGYSRDLARFADPYRSTDPARARALDLGCGKTPKNPFDAGELYGVDVDYGVDESARILPCDLGIQRLPFPDDHFDFVTAFDLIEHIPRIAYLGSERRSPFIHLMNEVCRVLKAGGIFLSDTPAYPRAAVFSDPTHVNVITSATFPMYFCAPHFWASRYGFTGHLAMKRQAWREDNLLSAMTKVQDETERLAVTRQGK